MEIGDHHKRWAQRLHSGKDVCEMAPRDHGKALERGCLVLTSKGWKTHGTLRVGDKVFTPDGNQAKIKWTSEESQQNLKITFSNGMSVKTNPLHEWVVIDRRSAGSKNGKARPDVVKVLETKQLLELGLKNPGKEGRLRWWLPRREALKFAEKDLLVHPYVLGMWLGDGCKTYGWIIQGKEDAGIVFKEMRKHYRYSKEYKHSKDEVYKRIYPLLSEDLESLNLLEKERHYTNKHIPELYLRGSIKQRLELLAGLIDSDGCVEQIRERGRDYTTQRVRFTNTNEEIIKGTEELCRGLGFQVTRSETKPALSSSGIQGKLPVFTLRITPNRDIPTRIPRKKIEGSRSKELPRISIESIESCEPAPGRCIEIDDPRGVYLVGRDLIPTHNSMSMARAYPIFKAKYDPWVDDILMIGPDQDTAVENLGKMKSLLTSRPSLQSLVPKNRNEGFNSQTAIRLNNGVQIKAKGIGSPLRGRHPQLIILDDVLNEKNSGTKDNREAIKQYFWEVVFPMKDKGTASKRLKGFRSQIVIDGTAQYKEDLYHQLQRNPFFVGEKLKAIINEELKKVLWPERYDYESLVTIREAMTPLFFSKEYQNEPLTEETTLFPPSLFEPIKDRNLSYVHSYNGGKQVYLGADFSVPGSADGDWTVVYVVEWDPDTTTFTPLHYWRARPSSMQEQIHQIELICDTFNVTVGCLEDNLFQGVYANHFRQKSTLPLRGNTVTHSGKHDAATGILSFRPQFENGRWRFPYQTSRDQAMTDLMILEFNGIQQKNGRIGNESFHDDIVMALYHVMAASKVSTFDVSWS